MSIAFYSQYVALIEEIERRFPVTSWRGGDVDIWPLARMELYLDMYWKQPDCPPPPARSRVGRAFGLAARPLSNLWKSRNDLAHMTLVPKPSDVLFLGDGFSLDCREGAWQDRFGESVIAALEQRGLRTFVMQGGSLGRLPWRRSTFAASLLDLPANVVALGPKLPVSLPGHEDVVAFLAEKKVNAPGLARSALAVKARKVSAMATVFEFILGTVKPKLVFVVGYFAGPAPALMLACRRKGILSIDLQRAPLKGAPMAYGWWAMPDIGYSVLPAVFCTWTQAEAAALQQSLKSLAHPWHQSMHGGHTQMAACFDAPDWERAFRAAVGSGTYDREILVALQPIGGHRADWNALAAEMQRAPASWRWWIRRHSASLAQQDVEFGNLLGLGAPNVLIKEASALPLPVLLRHMTAMFSLASGAASEAAMLGVPAFFLSEEARGPFPDLIEAGKAHVISPDSVVARIDALPAGPSVRRAEPQPDLDGTLRQLQRLAIEYEMRCRTSETVALQSV
jgi:hypothetical protein